MEASKEGEMPSAPAPESLPSEMKEEKPTKTKLIAAIVVVIVVIAAIGAAFAFGVFSPKEKAPVGGAVAVGDTTIDIGGSVKVNSTAKPVQKGATLTDWAWYWGDGTNTTGGKEKTNATHQYNYGGFYWIYQVVTDSNGKTGSNEASMIRVTVRYYDPGALNEWDNATAPFAVLGSDKDVIAENTEVTFNMSGSYGIGGWNWLNASNHSEGPVWFSGFENLTSLKLDYGDGSAVATITPAAIMTSKHTYKEQGHYAATLTATSDTVNPFGTHTVTTKVMRTIHVLSPSGSAGAVKNPGTFIRATIGEPDYLDPAVDYETGGGEILQNVYETLVWYDGKSASTLIPLLATEVPTIANGGISADGLNYTFHIRSNVKFHDGTTMTADDVVYSVQRMLRIHDENGPSWMVEVLMNDYLHYSVGDELQNWSTSSTPAWLLNAIGGTDPHYIITEKDVQNSTEAAVKKVDASTVTFRLTHPYPGFIYICAYTVMSIVSKAFVEANGGVTNGEHNTYMDDHTCGTGPYKMVEWTHGSRIHMVKNTDYWNPSIFKTNSINDVYIVLATDVNTRILMMQSGDADSADMTIDYRSLFTGSNFRISQGNATFDITFAGFNFEIDTAQAATFGSDVPANFFADVHLRRAFVHLMNYEQFISTVLANNALQPNGPIPLGMFGYDPSVPNYTYDTTLAENEFKAAINPSTGNSWWDDGFTIAFMFNAGNTNRETACTYMKTALESMNSKFHATINALDWPTYLRLQRANPSPFPMFWLGWAPDYNDPDDYCVPFLDSVYGSYAAKTGYVNTSLDALIRQAASELNTATRLDLYSQISWGAYYDVPYVWLYQSNNFHVERSWISGYYYNPMYSAFYYAQFTKG